MARPNPFAVQLSEAKKNDLIAMLRHEIQSEIDARSSVVQPGGDLDYYRTLYEGGDRTLTKTFPWPGAANLTSYLGTESVDAVRARIVQTIWVDPIWIVAGFGPYASQAPFVEEFHQWKAEEERLQGYLRDVMQVALLEGTGILEVFERPIMRRIKQKRRVEIQRDPLTGGIRVDAAGQPMPVRDEFDDLVDAIDDSQPSADVVTNTMNRIRKGPRYRVHSLRDVYCLPGSAHDREDIWGWAKRVFKRVGDLKSLAVQGIYDKDAVAACGDEDERTALFHETRRGIQTATRLPGNFAEKELWEIPILLDLDNDGHEEWYLITMHLDKGILLRVQRDDLNLARFLPFTPFPRPDSIYGYTCVEKIINIIEEHTGILNATADRSTLVNAAPITRVHGSPWNPFLVPWGPLAIMDVRDHNEVKAMQIPDVPGSMIERAQAAIAAKERVMGLSDSSLGVHPQVDRTLGEVQLVNLQSAVRVDEILKNVQEPIEDLFQIRHRIWVRTYEDDERGERIPSDVLTGIEERGIAIGSGTVTANMLRGDFRGKPHGSTDTADLTRMRGDYNGFLQAIGQLAQNSPMIAMTLGQPEIIKMIMTQAMRVYRWPDTHSLTVALQRMEQQQQMQQQMQQLNPEQQMPQLPPAGAAPPAPPAAPPGGPPQLPPA
jgi:hypothetical protein